MKEEKWIAVDFDGTLVVDDFPRIGEDNPFAVEIVKRFRDDGCKIMLHTCRQNKRLRDAIRWMEQHGITPDAVNDNPYARMKWGGPRGHKVFADIYIDDHSIMVKKTVQGAVDWHWIKQNYGHIIKSI